MIIIGQFRGVTGHLVFFLKFVPIVRISLLWKQIKSVEYQR